MKIKKLFLCCLLGLLSVSIFNCSSGGVFNESNMTDVKLGEANYNIVARDVTGESKSAYILGATISNGMNTSIYAVARVSGTSKLYSDAINNLWKNAEKTLGTIEGKKYALINVRYDANALNLLFYTSVTITVRADVVEFFIP